MPPKGGGLSPIHENVRAGTTERLVFSDLVRTSLSRQEDASLLRVILQGNDGLKSEDRRAKALKEVEVRELWRVAREKEILTRAKEFGLVSVENLEDRRKLTDQVASFTRLSSRFQPSSGAFGFGDGGDRGLWLGGSREDRKVGKAGRARPSSARPSVGRGTIKASRAPANPYGGGTAPVQRRPTSGHGDGAGGKPKPRARPSSAPVARRRTQTETKLMDITRTLLKGLESHKSADGADHALSALQKNVGEAQAQLSRLVAAAGEKLRGRAASMAAPTSPAPTPSDSFRLHLTKLGYFGSTRADLAVAEHQRRRHAALAIQRAARRLLGRKREERARLAAAEEAKRRQQERKCECARTIQSWYRGVLSELELRREVLARIRKAKAARTIQRWYRYARFVRIHRSRLVAEPPSRGLCRGKPPQTTWEAAVVIQKWFRMNRARRRTEAIRRAPDAFLRRRGALREIWRRHKDHTRNTLRAQSYLVFLSFSSGRETERVMAHVREEEKMFSTSWLKYERKVKRKALHKPLPRNWVPHNDAVTGKIYFINTRTSEAYTTHPNLREIAPTLAAQRERASIAKYARINTLAKYIDAIQLRATKLTSEALSKIV